MCPGRVCASTGNVYFRNIYCPQETSVLFYSILLTEIFKIKVQEGQYLLLLLLVVLILFF